LSDLLDAHQRNGADLTALLVKADAGAALAEAAAAEAAKKGGKGGSGKKVAAGGGKKKERSEEDIEYFGLAGPTGRLLLKVRHTRHKTA